MSSLLASSLALGALAGCELAYRPFDSEGYLRGFYAERVGAARAREIEVPFALDAEARAFLTKRLKPSGSEVQRANDIVNYIFHDLHLEYELRPTRNAAETLRTRRGNCLSFVNLFVGISRLQRLNAFYVEVTDAQSWTHSRGAVLSQGHIVGGLSSTGSLQIFDFLPETQKTYRKFKPIDDLTAAAHYFNNLGAEALLDGDEERAMRWLTLAAEVAPQFEKAENNLGVALARQGKLEEALVAFQRGLELSPDNEAILTNLVRTDQQLGRRADAAAVLAQLDRLQVKNPYFFLYKGDQALADGDLTEALKQMAEALRRGSELADVHLGLVKVYIAQGDLEKARHHLARALRLDAPNPEARRFAAMLQAAPRGGPP